MGKKTFVLIHGGFHGGWCWKFVSQHLRAMGHEVYTPTQTGLGERSHLISARPDIATFGRDLVQMFHFEDISDAIIVGHSFGGSAVSLVADQIPERIRHLVYLDALLLQSGQAPVDLAPPGRIEHYEKISERTPFGQLIPPADPTVFGIEDPKMVEWVRERLTSHPLKTFLDKIHLENPIGNGKPATYIACTNPAWPANETSRALARELPGWQWLEIAGPHDVMLTMPQELSEMLDSIG